MVHYSLDGFLSLIIVTSYGISTGRKESEDEEERKLITT
jgi:hypothetical protein